MAREYGREWLSGIGSLTWSLYKKFEYEKINFKIECQRQDFEKPYSLIKEGIS